MVELKACPFCGSSDAHLARGDKYHWGVCFQCRAEGPVIDTEELAATLWNTRASPWQELPATPTPGVAPWDGEKFWGNDDEDAIAMFWHPGFGEFVSRFNRMTLAPGYTYEDTGLNYQDHSPVIHKPTHWRRIDALPSPPVREGG